MTLSLIIYPLIPLGILFAFWPYLWQSPLENFKKIIDYYQEIGLGTTYQPQEFYLPGGFNTYALQWILYTTPLVILFFSLVGIMAVVRRWRKEQNTPSLLILFWFLVPILRVSLPKMGIYGGIRQIMEFIPAMAILAGLGAKYFITVVAHFSARLFPNLFSQKKYIIRYTLYIILLLTFLPILIKMIQIHPNQNVYFNPLIGGLKGAKARDFPDWGNSMGNVYRQGLNWINENAESQAELAFAYELLGNLPRIWVREDIKFTNLVRSGLFREGEYLIGSVTEPKAFEWYQLRYPEKFLIPVYQLQVDGVTLLKVWKNDHEHSRPEYLLPEKTIQPVSFKVEDVFLTISLPQEVLVTRIYFQLEKIGPEELKECLNETDSGGTFKFFPQKEKPLILPAASRVLAHKIKYQGPFYLFAAEKAKKIKFHFGQEGSCFEKTKTINVYRLKNLKP